MGFKVVSVDNGRSFDKSFCNGKQNCFQVAMSPAEASFNLNVETKPSDIWVEYLGTNWFIGDFAIRQRPKKLLVDRDSDKCNQQNIILNLVACSLYAQNENIILLTNVPARDYSAQQTAIQGVLRGKYRIAHKAGDLKGRVSEFEITECHAFPEGESAYFGSVFDLDCKMINKELWAYPTLIIDIGDETTNYISMNPGGEPVDSDSGTLKIGFHEVYNDIQKSLSRKGADINIPQLTRKLILNEAIYAGAKELLYQEDFAKRCAEFERSVYSELNSLLSLKQYRNIIFVGGAVTPLKQFLERRYLTLRTYFASGSQMLNCWGQHILYQLTKRG
jgi:hypothetical protein